MIVLNNISYNKLGKYESMLSQAYKGNYYSGATVLILKEIYEIVKNCGYRKSANFSCNSCRLQFLSEVGKAYFQYQSDLKETMRKVREGKIKKKEDKVTE